MASESPPSEYVPGKYAAMKCQKETECFVPIATRGEITWESPKSCLKGRRENIGSEWNRQSTHELKRGCESIVAKI